MISNKMDQNIQKQIHRYTEKGKVYKQTYREYDVNDGLVVVVVDEGLGVRLAGLLPQREQPTERDPVVQVRVAYD